MKSMFIISILLSCTEMASAQLWSEMFRQNKTQKKYLLQQIAALSQYANLLKDGYRIANEGLTFITDIKNGHFRLDNQYFQSFQTVNPVLQGADRYEAIKKITQSISRLRASCLTYCQKNAVYSAKDVSVVEGAFDNLLLSCKEDEREIEQVNSASLLELSDEARLQRMTDLMKDAERLLTIARQFDRSTRLYVVQAAREAGDIMTLAQWYGVK